MKRLVATAPHSHVHSDTPHNDTSSISGSPRRRILSMERHKCERMLNRRPQEFPMWMLLLIATTFSYVCVAIV